MTIDHPGSILQQEDNMSLISMGHDEQVELAGLALEPVEPVELA